MNKFFVDIICRLRRAIPFAMTDQLRKMKEAMETRQYTFQIRPVSETDLIKIISNLKNSSATGVDHMDTRTVKLADTHH